MKCKKASKLTKYHEFHPRQKGEVASPSSTRGTPTHRFYPPVEFLSELVQGFEKMVKIVDSWVQRFLCAWRWNWSRGGCRVFLLRVWVRVSSSLRVSGRKQSCDGGNVEDVNVALVAEGQVWANHGVWNLDEKKQRMKVCKQRFRRGSRIWVEDAIGMQSKYFPPQNTA